MEKHLSRDATERFIEMVRRHKQSKEHLDEDLNKFMSYFRRLHHSANRMSFKAWCEVVEGLLDELN